MCPICKREMETLTILGGHYLCSICADRLAHAAPDLLAACEAASDLLARWWTPDVPTVNEVEAVKARLEAVRMRVRGQQTLPGLE